MNESNKLVRSTDITTHINIEDGHLVGLTSKESSANSAKYIPCDGRELDAIKHPNLYEFMGNSFGGSYPKFNLPDMSDDVYYEEEAP